MTRKFAKHNMKPIRHDIVEEFVFGDGETTRAKYSYEYPVFLKGKWVGSIDIALVDVPCPPLFSLGMAKRWKCICDHDKDCIYMGEFDHTIKFTDTPFVNIIEKKKDGSLALDRVPSAFKEA
jgi:hypothetical protein